MFPGANVILTDILVVIIRFVWLRPLVTTIDHFNHTFNQTFFLSTTDSVSDPGVCVADLEAKLYLFSVLRHWQSPALPEGKLCCCTSHLFSKLWVNARYFNDDFKKNIVGEMQSKFAMEVNTVKNIRPHEELIRILINSEMYFELLFFFW